MVSSSTRLVGKGRSRVTAGTALRARRKALRALSHKFLCQGSGAAAVAVACALAATTPAQAQIRMPPLVAPPMPRLPVLHGLLVDVDSTPLADASVLVDWGGMVDTLRSDADGRFAMMLRQMLGDSLTLTVVPGAAYLPARLRVHGDHVRDDLDVVLLPRRWAIRGGAFAGDLVAISPSAALRHSRGGGFGRIASPRTAPRRDIVAWPAERLPIPLAIERDSGPAISDADSVALWRTVAALEAELGMKLFRPADDSTVREHGWGTSVRVDPHLDVSGVTFDTWEAGGRIFDAAITVRHAYDFGSRAIMFHELLHALGFGHTTAWPSIMTRVVAPEVSSLTREDVAYAQLLLRLGSLQRALDTPYGLREAAAGEQAAVAVQR